MSQFLENFNQGWESFDEKIDECLYVFYRYLDTALTRPFISYTSVATKINTRNFLIVIPYLRYIVEQPIDRLYCSILIS